MSNAHGDYVTLARLAVEVGVSYAAAERALAELGIRPSFTINAVRHYAADVAERLLAHLLATPRAATPPVGLAFASHGSTSPVA